jgi:predicted DNA-binding transcriptional regulator AlpA
MERLLTTQEVADLARTTPATVRYWRHCGNGPRGFKLGRKIVYREEDVTRWLDQQYRASYADTRLDDAVAG